LAPEKIRVIPHGELSAALPPPLPQAEKLTAAVAVAADYGSAASWRVQTAWARGADLTAAGYREVLGAGR